MAPRNSTFFHAVTASFRTLPYNHLARTTQKTQPLCYCECVFTTALHSNGSYSIVACVFVVAGICLPGRCLAMNVYSYFAIPDFRRHITISHKSVQQFRTRNTWLNGMNPLLLRGHSNKTHLAPACLPLRSGIVRCEETGSLSVETPVRAGKIQSRVVVLERFS
jgi:hypothetical protein